MVHALLSKIQLDQIFCTLKVMTNVSDCGLGAWPGALGSCLGEGVLALRMDPFILGAGFLLFE